MIESWPKPDWECEGVRLYCGDCLEILPQLPAGCIDAVVTDPPYGIGYQSGHRGIQHEPITGDGSYRLLRWACELPMLHSRYVFCRWEALVALPSPRSVIVWMKNNWSMGDLAHEHARQTELVCFWPGAEHEWLNGRPTDVVYAARADCSRHPTEKPVDLIAQILRWSHGVVFDPFMGSGTTGVACVQTGRQFVGIEIEQRYFDIAVTRIDQERRQGRLFREPIERGQNQDDLLPLTPPAP